MMMMWLFLLFMACVAAATNTGFLKMVVEPNEERCVGQQLDEEDAALFSYGAATPHASTARKTKPVLFASIYDPDDEFLLNKEEVVVGARAKDHKFEKIMVRGVHNLCFTLEQGDAPITVSFLIDFKSQKHANELLSSTESRVVKDDITMLEANLKQAEETLESINDEINFAHQQEKALKEAGDVANFRIELFSYFSMAVLFLTTLYQLWYLLSFFKSKKLL